MPVNPQLSDNAPFRITTTFAWVVEFFRAKSTSRSVIPVAPWAALMPMNHRGRRKKDSACEDSFFAVEVYIEQAARLQEKSDSRSISKVFFDFRVGNSEVLPVG